MKKGGKRTKGRTVSSRVKRRPVVRKKNQAQEQTHGIAGFVAGIFSILLFWFPLIGLGLGIMALIYSKEQRKKGSSKIGTAGFVLGLIGIILGGLITLTVILGLIGLYHLNVFDVTVLQC